MIQGEALPLRRLLGFALAYLGWRPADFWAATPCELAAALDALSGEDRRESFAAFKLQIDGEAGGA